MASEHGHHGHHSHTHEHTHSSQEHTHHSTHVHESGGAEEEVGGKWTDPLLAAAAKGRSHEVRTLISRGARIDGVDDRGHSALQLAAMYGHAKVVAQLLDAGAPVHRFCEADGWNALHSAAFHGHEEVVCLLLSANVPLTTTKNGSTALHLAVKEGHARVAARLVAAGIDVDAKNHLGQTALDLAPHDQRASITTLLRNQEKK